VVRPHRPPPAILTVQFWWPLGGSSWAIAKAAALEIIDIKHGGLEKWGFGCTYPGTSVPVEKVLDAAIEHGAQVVLVSTIITHGDMHRTNMEKLADLAVEKGVRDKLLLIAGGTQVTDERARGWGMDAGFGRRTKRVDVASCIVEMMRERGM